TFTIRIFSMIRALEGTCSAGVVSVGGKPVPGAIILSEGVGQSSGTVFIDGDKIFYVAKTTPDVKTILEKVLAVLSELTTALTAIDAKPVGGAGSAPAPAAAANIANIGTKQTELTLLNETLK